MAEIDKKRRSLVPKAKKTETLRQRTERVGREADKPKKRRIKSTAGAVGRLFKAAHRIGKKEYYLPMPDNRLGRFLNKPRKATPSFFKEAWKELIKVEWPNLRTTVRLVYAVFMFALLFGTIIAVVDYGLDKVFRKVFLD